MTQRDKTIRIESPQTNSRSCLMRHYQHLNITERESILFYQASGLKLRDIASRINRSPSTVCRELKRYATDKVYYPSKAQAAYLRRRENSRMKRTFEHPSELGELIKRLMRDNQWSPEQICGRLAMEQGIKLSYNTIYRAIWHRDFEPKRWSKKKHHAKGYEKYLRRKGKRRRNQSEEEKRGKIIISHSIDERPHAANSRSESGHLEADTVWGYMKSGCVLTLVDRQSRYLFAELVATRKASDINDRLLQILKPHDGKIKSITPDRGKEFAEHKQITEQTKIEFYFPLPGQPWQRGTNENTNGLLREYMPKRTFFSDYTNDDVKSFVDKINKRPRKILNWLSPFESFHNILLHFT